MRVMRSSACAMMILALLGGCSTDQKGPQAAVHPPPEVMVSQVIQDQITDADEFTGRMDSAETVDIRSRVSGYLQEIKFADGQEVQRGELLFQIDLRPFQAALENAEGQKLQWQAKLARAQADVARYEKLVPTGAATPQDLDKARADMGEATAAIQSAQAAIDTAKLDIEFARITAPIDGQISRAAITKGNLVRADVDVLTRIVSLDPIYVYFDVSERDLLRLRENASTQPAGGAYANLKVMEIPVYLGLANEQGYPHQGVVDFADNRVDPETGTITVRGTFDNSKRIFKPGLFARVRVQIGDPYQALLVAERAIGMDQSMRFVLTVDKQNQVQQRFVEPGPLQDDGLRVIKAGLESGDRVIVNGLQRARPGKPVTPQVAEMPRRTDETTNARNSDANTTATNPAPASS